jgi:hypothetical protein
MEISLQSHKTRVHPWTWAVPINPSSKISSPWFLLNQDVWGLYFIWPRASGVLDEQSTCGFLPHATNTDTPETSSSSTVNKRWTFQTHSRFFKFAYYFAMRMKLLVFEMEFSSYLENFMYFVIYQLAYCSYCILCVVFFQVTNTQYWDRLNTYLYIYIYIVLLVVLLLQQGPNTRTLVLLLHKSVRPSNVSSQGSFSQWLYLWVH